MVSPDALSDGGRNSPAAVFLGPAARFAVTAGLLWYAVHDIEWPKVADTFSRTSGRWVAVAVALVIVDRTVMAWRWLALLRVVEGGRPLPFGAAMRVFFVSSFAGTFLPAGVGADAVRAVSLARLGVSTANAVASVTVDRLLGTLSVMLMSVLGAWLVAGSVDSRVLPVAVLASIVATGGTYGLLFDDRLYRWVLRRSGVHRFPTVDRLAHKFLAATGQYQPYRGLLARVLAASLGVQVLRTLQAWALGLALGLPISGYWYFAAMPLIVLAMLLPISFFGLGVGNTAFIVLFGMAGINKDSALALSLIFTALALVGMLPGGLMCLSRPHPRHVRGA